MLLVPAALAAVVDAVPPGTSSVAVLVCPPDDTCDGDAAWVEASGGFTDAPVVRLELLLERDNGGFAAGVDTRAALAATLLRARAAAAKGRWAAVDAAVDDAHTALATVHGDVNTQTLFDIWYLDGAAAVARGEDREQEYALRQAAAIGEGQEIKLPAKNEALDRAWADERRKLVVGGTGTLALEGPSDARWSVDGVALGPGVAELRLLPGTHRVVASRAGTVRSWQAEAPVLAGRTVTITAGFSEADTATWLHARLDEAFDTLQGPPELTALLSEWGQRHGVSAMRLVQVEDLPATRGDPARVGGADPMRPAAADGERVDHGDGIPSTYTEEVLAAEEARREQAPGAPERRLRVMWFDPTLQRFSPDGPAPVREDLQERRFRVAIALGYQGMMGHHHAAGDVVGAWRVGPVDIEGRLGLVRADSPYNLYEEWVDPQLYHVALGVRWAPETTLAPYVYLGPEIYVPAAVGARLELGGQLRIERRWLLTLGANGGWLDQGPSWGASVGLGWSY